MDVLEDLAALRYYTSLVRAYGGLKELKKALAWSTWYATKWWDEIYGEEGVGIIRSSLFARSLYMSLRHRGFVDESGELTKWPRKPPYPENIYALEFVELHESFDRLGALNIALNKVDENTVSVLYSAMLNQGWYSIFRKTFLELVEIKKYKRIIEPLIKEGHVISTVLEIHEPELYVGYDYRSDSLELAKRMLKLTPASCLEEGICIFSALSLCDISNMLSRIAPDGFDAALMFDVLHWMLDPARELACIKRALKNGGVLLIGQQVAESAPGLTALTTAMGAKHIFTWKNIENLLKSIYFKKIKTYIKYIPYYISIWRN